jgi:hypothetical protein
MVPPHTRSSLRFALALSNDEKGAAHDAGKANVGRWEKDTV